MELDLQSCSRLEFENPGFFTGMPCVNILTEGGTGNSPNEDENFVGDPGVCAGTEAEDVFPAGWMKSTIALKSLSSNLHMTGSEETNSS